VPFVDIYLSHNSHTIHGAAAVRDDQHCQGHLRRNQSARVVIHVAETIVMVLLIFIPGLAAWLPHYFLG
jgi:hypothetical protein